MNHPSVRSWLRRVVWLGGAVALLWALAWLVVPPLLKGQLEKVAGAELGRKVTVGRVDFKPWSLELTLRDLAIASQDGASTQFQFKRLYMNAELQSLLRLAPVVDAIVLEGPRLRLTRLAEGKYDVDDILARFTRPDPNAGTEPLRFALFNLSLAGGELDFDDRPVGKIHQMRALDLSVPFLSNLQSHRAIKVEPRLAFSFNGSRFDSTALATPFSDSRRTDARITLRGLDLAPYLRYIPDSVPVRLQQAVLGADIKLEFEQSARPTVKLSGTMQLAGVQVADTAARDMLGFEELKVTLDEVRPLERVAKFSLVELTAPRLEARRDASGRINLDLAADSTRPAGAVAPANDDAWKVEVARFNLRGGAARWSDEAVAPHAVVVARDLSLEATDLVWPMAQGLQFQGSVAILGEPAAAAGPGPGRKSGPGKAGVPRQPAGPAQLTFSGAGTDQEATMKVSLVGLPLSLASPYLAQYLEPSLRGGLNCEVELAWKAPDLQLVVASLALADVALVPTAQGDSADLASVRKVDLSQARVDFAKHDITIGKLVVDGPRLAVVRGELKRWIFENWLRPGSAASGAPAPEWTVAVSDLALEGGNLSFEDKAAARPVAFELSELKLLMKDVRPDGTRPSPLRISALIKSGQGQPGRFSYGGTLQVQPLVAQGNLEATQLPVHIFEPYFGTGLNIELLRADVGFKGDVRYAEGSGGAVVKVSGDALVEEFRANSLAANDGGLKIAEELLRWQSLSLRGVDLALAPASATTVSVRETVLSDFFARVIVNENGRINLQDLVRSAPPQTPVGTVAGASAPVASSAPVAAAAADNTRAAGPAAVVNIGPVSLVGGKVFFSDRFVKPNYSANLSELTGKLSAFSSAPAAGQAVLADLELRGRAEGTAALEILGKLNPLVRPLALDIKATVRDLELPPLSSYSVKYAGYGIERGKLSVDVAYLVLPDGQLTASNRVVLNQLTFGDKVEGAPNSLPVKLAVALLSDRNGVIDINLPISGSLNDPQFSLGSIIVKVIVNLVVKAITAPFSLLASAFGGGDELSSVAFAAGSAALLPPARQNLDKVARALTERPGLRMTVVGTSSLEVEREAYKRELLQALLQAEKRRLNASTGAAAPAGADQGVSDAERPVLLKAVYLRADIARPRDAAGRPLEIPATEMEALLLANIAVTEDAMRELALQRGIAVKDYLGSQQLPVERLFLGAVKPVANDSNWSPRAELSLANN